MGFISILFLDALFLAPALFLLMALLRSILRSIGISDTFSEAVNKIEQSEPFIKLKRFFSALGRFLARLILVAAIFMILFLSLSFFRSLLFAS